MNIKKWILFFILIFFTSGFVAAILSFPLVIVYVGLSEYFKLYQHLSELDGLTIVFALPYFLTPFVMYGYAKVFGIFKDIDSLKLNFWLKLLIVSLVASFIFVLMYFPGTITDNGFAVVSNTYCYSAFFLIPDFLFYKLFQYLTIKLPNPFEQMAYYFSIEFYKSVAKKLFNKLKSKSKRD